MDFNTQVIEQSQDKPVLVDFWAPWCGPCRVLGPVLEQLAEEQKDRWTLVKINTEEHQELAMEFGIRSIPNVKLFHKGKVINEFMGALPKTTIEKWLDENIPSESKMQLEAILAEQKSWPDTDLIIKLENFLVKVPGHKMARLHLARHLIFDRPHVSKELIADFKDHEEQYEVVEDLRSLARLLQLPDQEDDRKVALILHEAKRALLSGQQEQAIQKLIEAAGLDKSFEKDLPRKSAIALFRLWGTQHPLTREYRRTFDMVLY